jgi:hypothetical protein
MPALYRRCDFQVCENRRHSGGLGWRERRVGIRGDHGHRRVTNILNETLGTTNKSIDAMPSV